MSSIKIIFLKAQHPEIVRVITAAFDGYPLMNFFFGDANRRSIEAIGQYICDLAMIEDSLLLGALVKEELQGFIFVTPPETDKDKDENAISNLEARLARSLSDEALERIDIYSKLKNANKPAQTHFYINMLGVNPRFQKMGIGRKLLEHIHTLSDEHSSSRGVALDTQTENNVTYYQKFGYEVSSIENLDLLKNWFMFRAKA